MVHFKTTNAFANRGKGTEEALQRFLQLWAKEPRREFNRLLDSKAAGRTVKAAAADFEFFCQSSLGVKLHGLIEAKETKHLYRLDRDKVPQLARLRRRANCGGICIVVVYHSESKLWRAVSVHWLTSNGDKGSWNLGEVPAYPTVEQALCGVVGEVFSG